MSTATHIALGEHGESLAVGALEREGYAVLARRYRTRLGEIDIIAEDQGTIVFVEWPEAGESALPEPRFRVRLRHIDEAHRMIELESREPTVLQEL